MLDGEQDGEDDGKTDVLKWRDTIKSAKILDLSVRSDMRGWERIGPHSILSNKKHRQ